MKLPLLITAALALVGVAHADPAPAPAPIATYAIVVGSNAGGPGQADLKFAEDDARKVGALLVELGGYTPDQVDVVVHPSPDQLRERLGKLAERVAADAAAGRQSRVFFYYSGHARATAIDLGAGELPLPELRAKLFAVPATLTVVVLDACQSGAFSRVKGAVPAADFSASSRAHLDASGVAVLASSSGSELSQESEQLHGSYFTHHLLVGLRGAGDANGDGEVSIDEAYRYAYHQTLLATSETAVGGQHVTFEADLKGHGEVPLSYPRAATASIVLPAALEGQTLAYDKRAKAVVAEIYKAKGAPVRVAVAPGEYEVVVRHATTLSHCDVMVGGVVDLAHCREEAITPATAKGGGFLYANRIALAGFVGPERDDGYTQNLRNFGYDTGFAPLSAGLALTGLRHVTDRILVGGLATIMSMPQWSHTVTGSTIQQTFSWSTVTVMAAGRYEQPFGDDGTASHIFAFGQLAAGLGVGHTTLVGADNMTYRNTYFGVAASIAAGLRFEGPARRFGVEFGYAFDDAPVISDLIGNTHNSGGHRITAALTYAY